MITPELQEYYDKYFDLFSSRGWKQLIEEVIANISSLEHSTIRQGSKDVFLYNQGYVAALEFLRNYDVVVTTSYEELSQPEVDDADL
jgi:hypothetical protein